LGFLVGCGGGSTPSGVAISVSLVSSVSSVNPGGSAIITATVANDTSNSGVTFSLSGIGNITQTSSTTATYVAPSSVTSTQVVSITAIAVANTNASASVQITVNPSSGGLAVQLIPSSAGNVGQGQSLGFTATVANDSTNSGVSWGLSGIGQLVNPTTTTATYEAPASVTTPSAVTITATSIANTQVATTFTITVYGTGQGNVQPIAVDGGPVAGQIYPDGSFTNVEVCSPGTNNCAAVGGILVDTGSYGLRILQSALNGLSLAPLTSGSGNLNECVPFLDGSYLWGQVAPADVYLSGEAAKTTSIHVVADPTGFSIPAACTSNGSGIDEDNQVALGANGILGIGPEPQDCGAACVSGSVPDIYWSCSSAGCGTNPVAVPLTQQVTNPIVHFTTDNQGQAIQFPMVVGAQPSASGTITFGINSEANNQVPGTALVYNMDNNDNFITIYNSQTLNASFLDSGSNGYFFYDPSIPACTDFTSFYCPQTLLNLNATTEGANGSPQALISFEVDNTDSLFSNGSDAAYGDLGGLLGAGTTTFDWGMPFFFGRTTFTSIRGQTVSGEQAPPWWAY
jgi:hypothetical protein